MWNIYSKPAGVKMLRENDYKKGRVIADAWEMLG